MKKKLLNTLALILCISLFCLSGCAKEAKKVKKSQEKKYNVGFVYVAPVGDAGWTWAHDQGRKEMINNLKYIGKTKYIESVPEGGEATRVITQLAVAGFDVIFTTSFGYMDPTLEVAKKFPNKKFIHFMKVRD